MDHLDSKNLVPFKKRSNGYHLPKLTKEAEEQVIDEVDPELRPEEQGYVRHYLGYADVMLKSADAGLETELDEPEEETPAERKASEENTASVEENTAKENDPQKKTSAQEENEADTPVKERTYRVA